jgi:hypothetical protein
MSSSNHPLSVFLAFIIVLTLFGLATTFLWNEIMSAHFGLPGINILQALGMMSLGRLLTSRGLLNHKKEEPRRTPVDDAVRRIINNN